MVLYVQIMNYKNQRKDLDVRKAHELKGKSMIRINEKYRIHLLNK